MYKVKKIKPEKMSKDLYKKCVSLCNRQKGLMSLYIHMSRFKKTNKKCECYLIIENKKLLSWAIVYDNEVHYYTRKTHRRKGLAAKIAKYVNKDYKENLLVCGPNTKESFNFYKNYKYKQINFENE